MSLVLKKQVQNQSWYDPKEDWVCAKPVLYYFNNNGPQQVLYYFINPLKTGLF